LPAASSMARRLATDGLSQQQRDAQRPGDGLVPVDLGPAGGLTSVRAAWRGPWGAFAGELGMALRRWGGVGGLRP